MLPTDLHAAGAIDGASSVESNGLCPAMDIHCMPTIIGLVRYSTVLSVAQMPPFGSSFLNSLLFPRLPPTYFPLCSTAFYGC